MIAAAGAGRPPRISLVAGHGRLAAVLLAVDVGNTQTVFGLFDDGELIEHWRVATEAQRTGDELGALVGRFIDLDSIDGICLSSTVPTLIREHEVLAERWSNLSLIGTD